MALSKDALLDWLDKQIALPRAQAGDIVKEMPGFSNDDAYHLQAQFLKLQESRGNRLLGYKAAHTSLAIQQERNATVTVGGLLAAQLLEEGQPFAMPSDGATFIEPEIGVVLGRDLTGPGVTMVDAFHAIAGVFPAIEIVHPGRGGERSRQMGICISKSDGGYLFGGAMYSPSQIDLRLEGAVVSVNGVPKKSACGVEAMGHPVKVLAAIANLLGKYGIGLRAGMRFLTGSLTGNVKVERGDRIEVEFTRIGCVRARFE